MSKLKVFIKVAISIFILLFLIYKIGPDKLYQTLQGVKLAYMPLLILSLTIEFTLGATTLKVLINCLDKKIKFKKILMYFLRSYSLGLFVPAKLGEVSFVYFLNKEGIDYGKGTAIFILDKLITLITLSIVGAFGIFILFGGQTRILILGFLGVVITLLLYMILSNSGRGLIKRHILKKYSDIFVGFSKTFFYFLKNRTDILLLNFSLAFIRWTAGAVSVYVMFLALSYEPGFFYVWLIKPLTIIISLIPISIAGLGVREGTAMLLFNMIGAPTHITASVYFTFTAINYILASIINLYYLYRK